MLSSPWHFEGKNESENPISTNLIIYSSIYYFNKYFRAQYLPGTIIGAKDIENSLCFAFKFTCKLFYMFKYLRNVSFTVKQYHGGSCKVAFHTSTDSVDRKAMGPDGFRQLLLSVIITSWHHFSPSSSFHGVISWGQVLRAHIVGYIIGEPWDWEADLR